MSEEKSEIAKWYHGKGILITGATGFMGKVLVEKLLRSCPESGPLYLLIRDKRNISSSDRIKELLKSTLFKNVRETQPDVSEKLFAVHGDMTAPDLGISEADRQLLLSNVSVVFHVGATVRFDEPLRMALRINVQGVRSLLELCLGMRNLSAIIHMSTAYSNYPEYDVEERVYPPPCEPDEILHRAMQADDDELNAMTNGSLGDHANTYTFTKALAEHVAVQFASQLPIAIVRPSVVAGSIREPEPGWVDSINGPVFILRASKLGMFNYFYGDKGAQFNMIPVDVCINTCIAAAWEIGNTRRTEHSMGEVPVYNCVTSASKDQLLGRLAECFAENLAMCKVTGINVTPVLSVIKCQSFYAQAYSLYNTTRVLVADFFEWLSGRKPRYRGYYQKYEKAVALISDFTSREWKFRTDNIERLYKKLSSVDRKIFDFDITKIEQEHFARVYCSGICPIYVLIRDKRNVSSPDRIKELLKSTLWENVRATQPNVSNKLVAVHGNMAAPDLGISEADRHLLLVSVSVVFNVGATPRFVEPLRMAPRINVHFCKSLLELCLGMRNLSTVIHVSTAYSRNPEYYVEKRLHPPPCEPDEIWHRAMQLDDDGLDAMPNALLGDHANTYMFSTTHSGSERPNPWPKVEK